MECVIVKIFGGWLFWVFFDKEVGKDGGSFVLIPFFVCGGIL